MNICFFHGGFSLHGGIGRVVSILANGMSENSDYSVYSLSFYKDGKDKAFDIKPSVAEFYLHDQPVSMTKSILTNGILKLCKFIKKHDISVLIGCGALYYPLTVICARLCRLQSICWEHTNPEFTKDYKFQNIARKIGARLSNVNVLVSNEAKDNYDKRFPKSKNVLIWNPAAEELFEQSCEYNPKTLNIVSVGRLSYPKNFMRLLSIAKKLDDVNKKDWKWDIYGDGEERGALENEIKRLDLAKRVELKGNVNDMYCRYHNYSLIVMTSRYEGFPMVLIEGAANGLPMVSFDIKTGPKEIIVNGVNGYLINSEDDDAMVTAIDKLLKDKDLRLNMSKTSKATADKFSLNNILAKWDDVLRTGND